MKEKINTDREILTNDLYEINGSISQIKITVQSLVNRVEQVANRVSATKDKTEELNWTKKS
jgi:hypothetical protein